MSEIKGKVNGIRVHPGIPDVILYLDKGADREEHPYLIPSTARVTLDKAPMTVNTLIFRFLTDPKTEGCTVTMTAPDDSYENIHTAEFETVD